MTKIGKASYRRQLVKVSRGGEKEEEKEEKKEGGGIL